MTDNEYLNRINSLRRGLNKQDVTIYDSFAYRTSIVEADTGQAWSILSGNWQLDGNSIVSEAQADTPAMIGQDLQSNDMKFQVNAALVVGAGLFFRYKDKNNYFALKLESEQLVLYKYKAGVTYKLAALAHKEAVGSVIVLGIKQISGTIVAGLNDLKMDAVTDTDFMEFTVFGLLSPSADPASGPVPSASIDFLGTPSTKASYARNVWDMAVFDRRIYIGQGNSSNAAPAANSGPNPVVYFDLDTETFQTDMVDTVQISDGSITATKAYIDEAQLERFRIFDEAELYIPGHDATESASYANFYRKKITDTNWKKYRNLPHQYHNYDLYRYNNALFAGCSTSAKIDPNKQETGSDVFRSDDNGLTWIKIGDTAIGSRVYNFFELQGKLYASGVFTPKYALLDPEARMLTINEDLSVSYTKFTGTLMMPNIKKMVPSNTMYCRIAHPINVGDKLLYIYGEVANDHQITERALAVASGVNQAAQVVFPDKNAKPADIINRNGVTYVLTYTKNTASDYTIRIYRTADLNTWEEQLSFKQDTFAKSFEEYNGTFYFGLGTDPSTQSSSSGKILRIKAQPARQVKWNDFQASLL